MALSIKKIATSDLAKMAIRLDAVAYQVECRSPQDLITLAVVLQELVQRGVDISDENAVRKIAREIT